MNAAKNIAIEAMKQGGLEATGRAGAAFFKWLPHAQVKNGIPLLPSDVGSGKISKYVEDFLANVIPSADVMKTFKTNQGKAIEKAGLDLASGFSKFTGDSKAVGELIKGTLRTADEQILLKLTQNTRGQLTKKILNSPAYFQYKKVFEDAFISKIVKERNPEIIAGLIRDGGSYDLTVLKDALKNFPDVLDTARSRILKDILSETLTQSADPAMRKVLQNKGLAGGMQSFTDKTFAGKTFVHAMDEIGDARLKDIFGPTGYKSIKGFMETVKGVSGASGGASMIGRFYNLTYILGPLRGVNPAGLAGQAVVLRTLAKIITSPEGVEAINQYVRATAVQSPKLINAAVEVYRKQVDRAYKEQKIEEQMIKNHFENQGKGV
jgi:hypothetical protein